MPSVPAIVPTAVPTENGLLENEDQRSVPDQVRPAGQLRPEPRTERTSGRTDIGAGDLLPLLWNQDAAATIVTVAVES